LPKTGCDLVEPIRVGKELVDTAPIPKQCTCIFPRYCLIELKDDFSLPAAPLTQSRHAAVSTTKSLTGLDVSILAELAVETAASRMSFETASLTIGGETPAKVFRQRNIRTHESDAQSLDHNRSAAFSTISRANIDGDITLVDLAGIAGYSLFHFARKFALATGVRRTAI